MSMIAAWNKWSFGFFNCCNINHCWLTTVEIPTLSMLLVHGLYIVKIVVLLPFLPRILCMSSGPFLKGPSLYIYYLNLVNSIQQSPFLLVYNQNFIGMMTCMVDWYGFRCAMMIDVYSRGWYICVGWHVSHFCNHFFGWCH